MRRLLAAVAAVTLVLAGPAAPGVVLADPPPGTVVGWGDNSSGRATPPAGLTGVTEIAAGDSHNLALKSDGTVVGWGSSQFGQLPVPASLTGVAAIAAGLMHSLALKSDGTVVAWGYNGFGEVSVPADLTGATAIAAGVWYSLALKSDGTVVGWGDNSYGQATPPAGLTGVIAIAASAHSLALKSDGTVVGWGDNSFGQAAPPAGLTGVTAIAAGGDYSLAQKSDGTVVGWGENSHGQATPPAGLTGVTAIAAGSWGHGLALKSDGTVVGWGDNSFGQAAPPAGLTGVIAIAAGARHSLALKATEGSLKISKVFDPLTSGFTGTFAINYDCDDGTAHDGMVNLLAGGSATIGGIATGTSCVVSEPNLPTAPGGWAFDSPSISGSPATITQGDETVAVTVTVTNSISRDLDETAFEVHRSWDGSASIFVKFWPVATTLTATIDDPATVVSPDYQTTFDAVPTDNDGIGGGFGIEYEVAPGDVVTVTGGTTTKSHTVIDIEVTSVDVDTDRVSGTVPTPGSAVTVYTEGANRYFTADGSGNWMADFSVTGPDEWVFDIVPGASGGAEQFDADADSTVYDWEVPRPDGWQHNPATGHYYLYVEDGMSWADAEAHAVSLGGHLVTINDSAEDAWLMATLGTQYWIGFNDIAVEGEWVWSSGEPVTYRNWFPGEPNDYLGEDFAEIENRPPIGWNDVPGGQGPFVVEAEVAPPPTSFFSVSPIEPPEHMWGEEWEPDSEVTIEIDDPEVAGAVDFSTTAGTDGDGRFELYDIPFDIQAGHVVTVSHGTTAKTHEVIDLRVTLIDPVADTVSGVGSPNTETVVFVGDDQLQEWPLRNVTSDGAGAWTADFSVPSADGDPAFDILPPMMTYTYQADEDGDQTQIDARPPSFLVFLDWRGLAGWGWPAEVDLTVTADDPLTGENPDITLPLATNAEGFFEGGGVFPGLQPGWLITVTYGATTQTHTVRDISITDVDTATDIVRGTADPGTDVWVSVSGAEDGEGVVATADSSGEWAADFSAVYDITIGSEVGVQQEDENGNGTHFGYTVPFPPIPILPGTSLTTESNGTATSGTPTVYWQDQLTVSTTGRSGGTGTATLTMSDGYVQTIALIETPASSGTYTGTFAAPYPHHGPASISFTIDYPDGPDLEGSFTLYIDPSGVVRDTFGDPVVGATVTLYRSVDPDGPFVTVADGSAIMSPGNRTNPDLTGVDGLFGWDVVAGYYKVRAEKPGCFAPGGGGAFVETGVLTIPPPVTDLALVLDCLAVPTTLTYTGDTQVISPANTTLKATLADSESACNVVGKTVNFYIDLTGDGDFNDAGESIGTGQTVAGTNNSAQATLSPIRTLQPGVYLVKVAFAGTNGCAASEDANGIVSVVTPGDAASGGGWYQIAGVTAVSKSVNVGFGTRWDAKTRSFTGQILIHNKQAWRLKGEITSFARTSSSPPTGTASGTGQLFQWQVVSPGLYDYVLVDASVTFKVTFKDEGSGKKGKSANPDSITVNWIIDYSGGAVSPLVTGATFQPLKGGNITIR